MNQIRKVSALLPAEMVNMGGLLVRQPFPTQRVGNIDPFLLLHHYVGKVPRHAEPRHLGVGPHPHRGFSPVTFVFRGGVHHRDSRGNNAIVYQGVQWMHAGMGIIHSERPPFDIHERGGVQEIIQVWVNSPAKNKMDQPSYFPVSQSDIPTWTEEKVSVNIIAGELFNQHGPVPTLSPITAATVTLKAGGKVVFPVDPQQNTFLYLLDGRIKLDEFGLVEGKHAVVFGHEGNLLSFEASEDTRVLVMSGDPLNEKTVARGPFVMNTETEVLEAMRDYRTGKMGYLVEE